MSAINTSVHNFYKNLLTIYIKEKIELLLFTAVFFAKFKLSAAQNEKPY